MSDSTTLPDTQGKITLADAWDYKGCPTERATAANTVTNFLGTSFMLCLLGGFVADTFLGRYLTIAIFVTIQAMSPASNTPNAPLELARSASRPVGKQLTILYTALYLTALGTGGLKIERSLAAVTVLVYIQDNLGRQWGYGICVCAIVLGLIVFLSGTRRYLFKKLMGSPLTQIAVVFVNTWKKRNMELPLDLTLLYNVGDIDDGLTEKKKQMLPHSKQFRFLDKAAIKEPKIEGGKTTIGNKWSLTTLTDVEEVKLIIRMLPIWATTIIFWTVYAQMTTFSVSQATSMDRHIGKSFQIPPASLTAFFVGSILLTVPVYDRIIVPVARKVLNNPQGLTPLQRIGVGLVFSIFAMVAAALTEVN
ncbi:hypothetical protein C1H46_001623 [Malus baccata]|uniref:Major facilitator superfamily (MFS) profile domain-containing protein n=1 Tax=Malus baccata TaxID=106549 RepID=A0A540NQD5_MALBA|nr:hypothetical protein C1H46_001623 [Malus baccata]